MKHLGYCVYISTFEKQKAFLETLSNKDVFIFTSLHIAEEFNAHYKVQAEEMLSWLHARGFKVIGDVSKMTLTLFDEKDLVSLAKRLGLAMIRIDYGFLNEEILKMAKAFPVVFNASTVDLSLVRQLKVVSKDVFAIHNYYPREYTGLSKKQFNAINTKLIEAGIEVLGFIPNYKQSRGPIYEGLPTVEHERYYSPVISYFEMLNEFGMRYVLLSDLGLEVADRKIIEDYEETGIINLPCQLEGAFEYLYNQVFTIRIDSPECAYRLQESREFSTPGIEIEAFNCIERIIGSITCDNKYYSRYSGEIQVIRESLPKDHRVNVIGCIEPCYVGLTKIIRNGQKVKLSKK